jgi:hypothetical protein
VQEVKGVDGRPHSLAVGHSCPHIYNEQLAGTETYEEQEGKTEDGVPSYAHQDKTELSVKLLQLDLDRVSLLVLTGPCASE